SQENIYWLSVATTGQPARVRVRAPRPGAPAGPAPVTHRLPYEEDHVVNPLLFGLNTRAEGTEEEHLLSGGARPGAGWGRVPGRARRRARGAHRHPPVPVDRDGRVGRRRRPREQLRVVEFQLRLAAAAALHDLRHDAGRFDRTGRPAAHTERDHTQADADAEP